MENKTSKITLARDSIHDFHQSSKLNKKAENTPRPESEIFQKSNPELEVNAITELPVERPTTNLGLDGSRPTTNLVEKKDKSKRKLTEK